MSRRFQIYKKSKVYVVPNDDNERRDSRNPNMVREPVGNRDTYADASSGYDNEVDDSIVRVRGPSYKIYPPHRLTPLPHRRRRPFKRRYYLPEDDDLEETDRILPRFQYWYHQRLVDTSTPAPIELIRSREHNAAALKHQHLAAGVSFVALMLLMLFVCCLIPLFYYLCRPKYRKTRGFNLKEWFKENLTPKEQSDSDDQPDMPDFEKYSHEKTLYERPTIRYPEDLERAHRNPQNCEDKPKRTSLHIQLKETPLEMSISEVDEETEYISEMSDIGRRNQRYRHKHDSQSQPQKHKPKNKKHRSKSMPSTPAPVSPLDRLKKRFSFGEPTTTNKPPSSPSPKKAPASFPVPTPGSTATEEDEEVIYNRYSGKPIDDVTRSKSTQMIINTATAKSKPVNPASVQRGDDDDGSSGKVFGEHVRKTSSQAQAQSQSRVQSKQDRVPAPAPSSSTSDDIQPRKPNPNPTQNPPKSASQDYYENHMVKW